MTARVDTGARIARNALARSGGEVVAKVASLALFVTMARQLGSQGFGVFMFALGLTGALLIGAGFGTDELTARVVAADRSRAGAMVSDVGTLKLVLSLPLIAVALVVAAVGTFPRGAVTTVAIVGTGVAIEVLTRTWSAVFQGVERLALVSWSLVAQRVTTAVIGIVALHLGAGLVPVSMVYAGGALVGFATAEVLLRRLVGRRPVPRPRRWPGLLRAGLPFGIASWLFVFLLRVDLTVLALLAPAREVGFFAAAYRLVESSQFVTWAMTAAMLPWLVRAPDARDGRLARGYGLALKGVTAVLTPVGIGFVLFARPLVDMLYGPQFQPAVLPLQLLGLTCLSYGVQNVAITTALARNEAKRVAVTVAVVVTISLALNLVTVPAFQAVGAAGTALFSGVLLAVALTVQQRRRLGDVRVLRSFAGPCAGALAMTTVALTTRLPFAVEAPASVAAYLVALCLVEGRFFRDDGALVLRALRPGGFRRVPEPSEG